MNLMALRLPFLSLVLLSAACTHQYALAQATTELQWPVKKIAESPAQPRNGDAVVKLRKSGEAWVVDQDADLRDGSVEQIWFARGADNGQIVVMARAEKSPDSTSGRSLCKFGAFEKLADRRRRDGYTECTSEFFSCATTISDALLLLPQVALGMRVCPMDFEVRKVRAALASANVESWLIALRQNEADVLAQKNLEAYRTAFANIGTSRDADVFIERHGNFDPDGLRERAITLKAEIERSDAEARLKEATAKLGEAREQAILRQRTAENRLRKTAEFRGKLALGAETHCGPIIAIRGPMIQVATNVPLPGFTGEPWLRVDDVYPADVATCKNINGRLYPEWAN